MTTQYAVLITGAQMVTWWQQRHHGVCCKGGGIPERNDFVEALREAGFRYIDANKKDRWCCDIYVVLAEAPEAAPAHFPEAEIVAAQAKLTKGVPDFAFDFSQIVGRTKRTSTRFNPVVRQA